MLEQAQGQEVNTRNLDKEIQGYKDAIALQESLEALRKNPHFKKVIEEGYFKDFSFNLTMQRAFPDVREHPDRLATNTRKLDSISELSHYFRTLGAMATHAKASLEQAEALRTRIENEE